MLKDYVMKKNIPHHYSYDFKLNIDKVPSKESDRINLKILLPGMFLGLILLLLGVFELANTFYGGNLLFNRFIAENTAYNSFLSPAFFDSCIIILGLGIIFSLILSYLRYKKIFYDGKKITMINRDALGKKVTYQNNISDFLGVMFRVEFVQCGFIAKNIYIIELQHKNYNQTVPLYISTSGKNIRQIWVDYAKKLNLPTLLYTDEGILKRDVPDLDKSLTEMVDIWNLRGKFNPNAKHSFRIAVKQMPDKIIIKSRKILWDAFNIFGLFCLIVVLMTYFMVHTHAEIFSPTFLLCFNTFCFFILFTAIFVMFRKDKLIIKKDKIVNTHKYLFFSTKHDEILKKDIKGIYVTFNPATERYFVTITSSEKNIIFGKKLPIKDLKWVKNFLVELLINEK